MSEKEASGMPAKKPLVRKEDDAGGLNREKKGCGLYSVVRSRAAFLCSGDRTLDK